MNRFKVKQMYDGIRSELKKETEKLNEMYTDLSVSMETRETQKALVKDLEERFSGVKEQLAKLDEEAKEHLNPGMSESEKIINAKADLIRCVMSGKTIPNETLATLGAKTKALTAETSGGDGGKLLPSTMTNELLYEPLATNPLRGNSTFTNITNLEVPKVEFSLDDDDFIKDGETAKELEASADTITFGRNKFKVFAQISETVLHGTNTNLVSTVETALESGLAAKEKKVAFATTSTDEKSFYYKPSAYAIKEIKGKTMFDTIIDALADLEDAYSENAKVVMKRADYFKMIRELANGNATLYTAQPEAILGAPVIFCELATTPVVGDFRYSHFNYDLDMLYDRDKDVKTGMELFVLTAWMDHKIKMTSAFRLVTVEPSLP